jgi:hypothetical protein
MAKTQDQGPHETGDDNPVIQDRRRGGRRECLNLSDCRLDLGDTFQVPRLTDDAILQDMD